MTGWYSGNALNLPQLMYTGTPLYLYYYWVVQLDCPEDATTYVHYTYTIYLYYDWVVQLDCPEDATTYIHMYNILIL